MKENKQKDMTDNSANKIPSRISKIERIPSTLRYVLSLEDEGKVFRVLSVNTARRTIERWGEEQEVLMLTVLLKEETPLGEKIVKTVRLYYPFEGDISPRGKAGAFLLAFKKALGEEKAQDPENWIGHLVKIDRWREGDNKVTVIAKSELAVTVPVEVLIRETVKEIIKLERTRTETTNLVHLQIGKKLAEIVETVSDPGSKFFRKSISEVMRAVAKEYENQTGVSRKPKSFRDYYDFYTKMLSYQSRFGEMINLCGDKECRSVLEELADYFREDRLLDWDNPMLKYFRVLYQYGGKVTTNKLAKILKTALNENWTPDKLADILKTYQQKRVPPKLYSIGGIELSYKQDIEDRDGLATTVPVTCDELVLLKMYNLIEDKAWDAILAKLKRQEKEKMVEEIERYLLASPVDLEDWIVKLFNNTLLNLLAELQKQDPVKAFNTVNWMIAELTKIKEGTSSLVQELAETEVN